LYVGGLIGSASGGSVNNSYSTCSVTGTGQYVGGLVGTTGGGSITGSYAVSNVIGTFYVGGLVGLNYDCSVTSSYSAGIVTGAENVGGLAGWSYGNVTDSYSAGTVNGTSYVGGLIGLLYPDSYVSSSYSIATVTGSQGVGGLIGSSGGNVNGSYWYNQTGDNANNCCGTGTCTSCSTASPLSYFYSKTNAPMSSWDFVNVWRENVDGAQMLIVMAIMLRALVAVLLIVWTAKRQISLFVLM
jgi:hypothetical protein